MSGEKVINIVAAETDPPYVCGKHQLQLTHVLRGGAGHCASCSMFVQSVNHAEPLRDIPRPEPKQAKRKAKKKATIKRNPMLSAKLRNPMLNESPPARIVA